MREKSKQTITYSVYIVRTCENTLYTGQTNNLLRRIREHKSHNAKSAKYLRRFKSFRLVYTEGYTTRKEAMQREIVIKRLSRAQKDMLIISKKIILRKNK